MSVWKTKTLLVAGMASLLLTVGAVSAPAADKVTLKAYQAFRFADQAVTESGDKTADLHFYVNRGRRNAYAFSLAAFGAQRIQEFTEKPVVSGLTPEAAEGWDDYVNAPSPGNHYALLGADGNSLYLVKLLSFENQGKASAFWELTFSWEKIGPR